MRERYEIQNELNDGYVADTLFVPLTPAVLEDAHKRAFYRHTRIQTGILLDLRDQNERIIELLQNQHVQMRAVALQALVDTMQQTKIEAIGYTQDAQGAWHWEESREP